MPFLQRNDLALSQEEITAITGYARATYQMRVLKELGIPARRRPDNTVLVLRMHLVHPTTTLAKPAPRLKSARP